ncbi:hypothetical protein KIW84_062432 [Lathyrus oleraceus]|uniref:RRM domain-containing protein n=1 Tax=Pisum sativum TaxID=3888 RepID=A0A9D5A5K3_PEA|nr:hypothetical protein KIW84_062432 [Pisum sativum]
MPWGKDFGGKLIFSKYGKVESIEIVTESNGRSRGYGFVTMSSKTEMDDVIPALDLKVVSLKWFLSP